MGKIALQQEKAREGSTPQVDDTGSDSRRLMRWDAEKIFSQSEYRTEMTSLTDDLPKLK